ncbi:MAG: type II toxin-antitoxin system HicA family toxin [Candidatus Kapabacteria bacterium]|nr:type II toxin-antitoxin system HicA family toxin [Candidatus Kapabacteria bacterium]
MSKLNRISGNKAIKVLTKLGFSFVRQKGSHVIMKKNTLNGEIGCVVPLHDVLAIGTLSNILKQANLSKEEFLETLKTI